MVLVVKNPPANAGDPRDTGWIPGSGRCPGGGMATRSNIPAWKIPWTEEPGKLQSMGLQRVQHDWAQTNPIYVEVLYACAEQILLSYWYLPHQYITSWPIPFVEERTSYLYTTPLFFFFFFATLESHGVLVPQPKIQPSSPALEAWYLKHWNYQGHPYILFLKMTFLLEKTSNLLLKALLSSQNPTITMEDKPLKL